VEHAVRFEQAARLEDVLGRRTQLLLRAPEDALEAAPEVAARMAALLDWDPARQAAEVEAFTALVRGSLCCRESAEDTSP
jgi:glycerol-3-phosphate dehydrogenase